VGGWLVRVPLDGVARDWLQQAAAELPFAGSG
jgi:hypothetical protein